MSRVRATLARAGLDFLLRSVERGELDHVVVHRVDRLSRNLGHFVRLLEFFKRFEVEVSFVDGPVESTGSFARLQLSMLGTFAEFEHAMISERLTDARRARRERGLRSAGRLPFGYRSDPETKQLVPNPPDSAFVRRCFERAAAGVLPAQLAADGVRRGGALAKWTARAVTRMLRNPVYAGRFPDGGVSTHEALVSAELFERAGTAVAGRTTARTPPQWRDRMGHPARREVAPRRCEGPSTSKSSRECSGSPPACAANTRRSSSGCTRPAQPSSWAT